MVTIRLARGGAKKRPYFHITVADSRRARDGKYIERVGFFNPIASAQDDRIKIDHERLDYWISKGAKITDRVKNIIKQSKFSPEEYKQPQPNQTIKRKLPKKTRGFRVDSYESARRTE